jgi:hypothetical protein
MYVRSYLPCRGGQFLDGLELDNDQAVDEQVGAESIFKDHAVVLKADGLLTLDKESAALQGSRQHDLVDGLEEAGAEIFVDVDGSVDDCAGDVVELEDLGAALYHGPQSHRMVEEDDC